MRESIFAHSLQIGRLGTTRQLLGVNQKGDTVILAQLPAMTDERALLVDRKALARALQFHLIDDIPQSPRAARPRQGKRSAQRTTLGALISIALALALQFCNHK